MTKEMKMPLALIMAIAVQAGGMLWYVSKIDSKVEIMYSKYKQANQEAVIENQIMMRLDLADVVEGMAIGHEQIEQLTQMVEELRQKTQQLIKAKNNQGNAIKKLKQQIKNKQDKKKKKKKTKGEDAA
jgi:hypothetical protein|tara:strand:+ start:98 stop:481 length:384 start_codon:yes stop_codon:yes gene_type:complete